MRLKTPINKETFRQHLTYNTWKYLVMLVAVIFGWNLIYTVTAYRPPEDKRIDVYIQSATASDEKVDAFLEPIWREVTPDMESVHSVLLAVGEDYTTNMQLTTYIAAGEGDIYFLEEDFFKSFASQGAFVELDELVENGTLDLTDIDASAGRVKIATQFDEKDNPTVYEQHLYGVPLKSLYGYMTELQVDNRNLYAVIMVSNHNDENVVPFFNAMIQAGRGEKPDWIE